MLANFRVASPLLVGFGFMMLMVAGLSGLVMVSVRQSETYLDLILRAKDNGSNTNLIGRMLAQGQSHLWLALSSGEPADWQAEDAALTVARQRIDVLIANTLDARRAASPRQLAALTTSFSGLASRLKDIKAAGALDLPASRAVVAEAGRVTEAIETLCQQLGESYVGAAADRTATVIAQLSRAMAVGALVGAVSLILGFVLALTISCC
jgi:hypothetical protein